MKTQLREVEEKVKALAAHRESGEEKETDGQQQALAEMKAKLRAELVAMELHYSAENGDLSTVMRLVVRIFIEL